MLECRILFLCKFNKNVKIIRILDNLGLTNIYDTVQL